MKPKYRDGVEEELHRYFDQHQDDSFEDIGNKFGISGEDARKLSILWYTGAKDSFKMAVFEMFEDSPTVIK